MLSSPPRASALALVFRELKVLSSVSLLLLVRKTHLDSAKAPGIPHTRKAGLFLR